MGHKTMQTIRDTLNRELQDLAAELEKQGGVSARDLENLRNLTGALKNLHKIERYESCGSDEPEQREYRHPQPNKQSERMKHQLEEWISKADDESCADALRRCMRELSR